jgi:hypothetical protein
MVLALSAAGLPARLRVDLSPCRRASFAARLVP